MRELPILFKPEMHRAIRERRKTQTRQLIKPQPSAAAKHCSKASDDGRWCFWPDEADLFKPRYQVGDRLWVREALVMSPSRIWLYQLQKPAALAFVTPAAADLTAMLTWAHHKDGKYCNPLHMPKWAARTWLEVREVRAQRVQDISEEDAIAEGFGPSPCEEFDPSTMDEKLRPLVEAFAGGTFTAKFNFNLAFDEINGPSAVSGNPWVWAYTFDVI